MKKLKKFPIPGRVCQETQSSEKIEEEIKTVVYLGLDVHKEFYQAEAEILSDDKSETIMSKLEASSQAVLDLIADIEDTAADGKIFFMIGYEAGPTGVQLKLDLEEKGYHCDIIPAQQVLNAGNNKKIKTDSRDAHSIVQTLQIQDYKAVFVSNERDREVKGIIRLRQSFQDTLKKRKQQLKAFLLEKGIKKKAKKKNGKKVNQSWTEEYYDWLRRLKMNPLDRERLDLLIEEVEGYDKKVKQLDKKIKRIAESEEYLERVRTLTCFIGIGVLTALSFIVEIGDFRRFPTPGHLASYIGLVPGEKSSGQTKRHTGITKTGNKLLRKLAIMAACNMKKALPNKSDRTLEKQKYCSKKMIEYADRCFIRLMRRRTTLLYKGKNNRLINAALARELVCFIWGAMTNHID